MSILIMNDQGKLLQQKYNNVIYIIIYDYFTVCLPVPYNQFTQRPMVTSLYSNLNFNSVALGHWKKLLPYIRISTIGSLDLFILYINVNYVEIFESFKCSGVQFSNYHETQKVRQRVILSTNGMKKLQCRFQGIFLYLGALNSEAMVTSVCLLGLTTNRSDIQCFFPFL